MAQGGRTNTISPGGRGIGRGTLETQNRGSGNLSSAAANLFKDNNTNGNNSNNSGTNSGPNSPGHRPTIAGRGSPAGSSNKSPHPFQIDTNGLNVNKSPKPEPPPFDSPRGAENNRTKTVLSPTNANRPLPMNASSPAQGSHGNLPVVPPASTKPTSGTISLSNLPKNKSAPPVAPPFEDSFATNSPRPTHASPPTFNGNNSQQRGKEPPTPPPFQLNNNDNGSYSDGDNLNSPSPNFDSGSYGTINKNRRQTSFSKVSHGSSDDLLSVADEDFDDDAYYPFDEPDGEQNIVFTAETAMMPRPEIKGGTLEKLVQRLTFEAYPDPDFTKAFLLTYRTFTTPSELLSLLILRYLIPKPKHIIGDAAATEEWMTSKVNAIRLRVFNVMNQWVRTHFYDFDADKSLINTLNEFITSHMMSGMPKAAEQLKKLLSRKLDGTEVDAPEMVVFNPKEGPPPPLYPPNYLSSNPIKFLDWPAMEISRQLTMIEYNLFKSIKPWECLNQAWTKKTTRDEKSPNIMAMIGRFNQVSRWVATEVVKEKILKQRTAVLDFFINVAIGCRELKNYNGMMEIVSGLQSSSVYRLNQTWAGVSKAQKRQYEEIHELMSREKNHNNFRTHLHSVDPPCIPYLGVYLTDLTFIEDGNKDYIKVTPSAKNSTSGEGGSDEISLINFVKRRKIANVIREIQQYQQTPYPLTDVPELKDFLLKANYSNEDDCYKMSTANEAKVEGVPAMGPGFGTNGPLSSSSGGEGEKSKGGGGLSLNKTKIGDKIKGSHFTKLAKLTTKDKSKSSTSLINTNSPQIQSPVQSAAVPAVEEEEDFGDLEIPEGYLFKEKDSNDNIIFDIDVSQLIEGSHPTIKAATLEKLVERLTHESWPDPQMVNVFLQTYLTFCTPKQLLDLLAARFCVPKPVNKDEKLQSNYTKTKIIPIRLRVFNFLKNWAEKYFDGVMEGSEYNNGKEIVEGIDKIADLMIAEGMTNPGNTLKKVLQKIQAHSAGNNETGDNRIMLNKPPPILTLKNYPITSSSTLKTDPAPIGTPFIYCFHPEEIARQFTLIDFKLFQNIKPIELLKVNSNLVTNTPNLSSSTTNPNANPNGTIKGKNNQQPNIQRIMDWNNRIQHWVQTTIVKHAQFEDAVKTISLWIKIATSCSKLNNFNAVYNIVTALNSTDIIKLKLVWAQVAGKGVLNKLRLTLDDGEAGGWKKIMDKMRNVQPPCVPFMGGFLQQLKSIEFKFPDYLNGGKLVSFEKKILVSSVMTEIMAYQQNVYCFEEVGLISEWIKNDKVCSDSEINEFSITFLTKPGTQTMGRGRNNNSGEESGNNRGTVIGSGSGDRGSVIGGGMGDKGKMARMLGIDESKMEGGERKEGGSGGGNNNNGGEKELMKMNSVRNMGKGGGKKEEIKKEAMAMLNDDEEWRERVKEYLGWGKMEAQIAEQKKLIQNLKDEIAELRK
eukprot:TRINITY_DN728_c1_g2_i1.p1 TRINITY_DN728_c1_g2~~TRINITY_DN728_c1_g2_i1.p1  ORF type:complete len:1443 (-),score=436.88 TRINITY_DN728_c1_g2_i1:116-4444(-)